MTAALALTDDLDLPTATLDAAIATACRRIAPLWPLRRFVAVNPFLGFTDCSFGATAAKLRRVAAAETIMPPAFFRDAAARGELTEADFAAARAELSHAAPATLTEALAAPATHRRGPVVATVAEVLDTLAAGDRQASRTAFMVDEISKWCAAYFDDGQAAWHLPTRDLTAYAAWRASMRHDRNPEAMGIAGFRGAVAALPDDPRAAIAAVVAALGIPPRAVEDYLFRALFDIGGWAAHARFRSWDNALYGRDDDVLVELLAIRMVWGYALFLGRRDVPFRAAWSAAMASAAALPDDARPDSGLATDLLLQRAYEAAYQRRLFAALAHPVPPPVTARPAFHVAFCIDVRSEVFRRALEAAAPDAATLGFAGFFGFALEFVPLGRTAGTAQCPVLLKPGAVICEAVGGASADETGEVVGLRAVRRRATKAWKAFKLSAVSSFAYVETTGLLFAGKLASDSAGWTRPVTDPATDGLDPATITRTRPDLTAALVGGRAAGLTPAQRIDLAEGLLRGMSLTAHFARLVVIAGHGSTTVNNPHAAGLDCGACGGHTGEANARVAATVLNDPSVRDGLSARGVSVPADTWFVAALHDTTTDAVALFDTDGVPAGHRADLDALRDAFSRGGAAARAERAGRLGVAGDDGRAIVARSRDWSQVRPEWGLARNAAFIAAPRAWSRGVDLDGRAFLHDYDWQEDAGFAVLESILTAPVVVASWINLQYYAATVNNRVFGSGNKALHNVVGQIGVLEGNAGDLKVGLPLQSVDDGAGPVHLPVRLTVIVAAPEAAISGVLAKHASVRELVDNGWLHLFAVAKDGAMRRYAGGLRWA